MALSCKVSVIDKPEYRVYFERYQGLIWIHCDIIKWSTGIAKRLRKDWDYVFNLYNSPIYALNEPHGCKRHKKFMEMMGFRYFGTVEADVVRYVYRRG